MPPTGTSDADAQGEVARLRSELGSAQGTIAGLRAELEAARRTTVATEKREGTLRGELEEARAEVRA